MNDFLMSWITYFIYGIYMIILLYTIIRILLDTHSTSKTLAYLMVVIIIPLAGIVFYYSFGINYRRSKTNRKMGRFSRSVTDQFRQSIPDKTAELVEKHSDALGHYLPLVHYLDNLGHENLTENSYQLLINGEQKFPEVLNTLKQAQHHIHMEYYDWENDTRGNQIKNILLQKAKHGVKVKIMYDAYASRKIRKNIVKELQLGGVEIYPVIKVKLTQFANRINHRDHRKIIIMDGIVGFVGGINVSDRYDNSIDTGLYWRDTHIKITGPGVMNLQRHFLVNWNACQPAELALKDIMPKESPADQYLLIKGMSQIVAGGPIYSLSTIMLSYARLFTMAREKLYITNPYFIPNETILDALKLAAKSRADVRLLLPEKSDSAIVGAASRFYFRELLEAGVRIFLYRKGFVHAKTVVADTSVSIVGTANMDIRSFDLNFEIMPVIYGNDFAKKLEGAFHDDLKESDEVSYDFWMKQSKWKMLIYAIARLISSFL